MLIIVREKDKVKRDRMSIIRRKGRRRKALENT
jgi:hypothetical protein